MTQRVRAPKVGDTRHKKAFPDMSSVRLKASGRGRHRLQGAGGGGGGHEKAEPHGHAQTGRRECSSLLFSLDTQKPRLCRRGAGEPSQPREETSGHQATAPPSPRPARCAPLLMHKGKQEFPDPWGRSFTRRVDIKILTEESSSEETGHNVRKRKTSNPKHPQPQEGRTQRSQTRTGQKEGHPEENASVRYTCVRTGVNNSERGGRRAEPSRGVTGA